MVFKAVMLSKINRGRGHDGGHQGIGVQHQERNKMEFLSKSGSQGCSGSLHFF